jgi:hypothetical protein
MRHQAAVVRDPNTAQHHVITFAESVYVDALPYANVHLLTP